MSNFFSKTQQVITSVEQWHRISGSFTNSPWLAVDTEFMRERTYYPQLALVQLAAQDASVCLDVCAFDGREIVASILGDPLVIKLMHSASQDIEVLGLYCGVEIQNLYDTQLAAEFCGYSAQVGYAGLVNSMLSVDLPKTQTRTNWLKRPLTQEQIDYAIQDVTYLKPMHNLLQAQLEKNGYLQWYVQDQQFELNKMNAYKIDPAMAYQRFRSGHRLKPASQQILKKLLQWREQTAQDQDLPKSWLLSDKQLYLIAEKLPKEKRSLKQLIEGETRYGLRYSEQIVGLINQPIQADPQVVWSARTQSTDRQKSQVAALKSSIQEVAKKLHLPDTRLATRNDIEAYIIAGEGRLSAGWRAQLMQTLMTDSGDKLE